jgi:hypothetical protein
MSKLFWAVYDEEQKKKAEEILATFDKDSKDEMGLMGITMTLSSLMFPGTSVLHTRLRYIYLVGWIFLEAFKSKKELSIELLHQKEKELRQILQEQKKEDKKEFTGILGSTKIIDDDGDGEDLSQPPFSVYLNLLKEWNIIRDKTLSVVELEKDVFCLEYIEIIEDSNFKNSTFLLTKSEKKYIAKKIPTSILNTIFNVENDVELEEKQHFVDFEIEAIKDDEQKKLFQYAQNFSLLMWGTMLYYNYYLGNESDDLKKKFEVWRKRVKEVVESGWKPEDTLSLVSDKVKPTQKEFVNSWYKYVGENNLDLENPNNIDNISVKTFLTKREQQLKGNRSRLLKKQKGEILEEAKFGVRPIEYRWSNIVRFKKDFDASR